MSLKKCCLAGIVTSSVITLTLPAYSAEQADQVPSASKGTVSPERLRANFRNPPRGTRPLVWWHWMNGNISKEGIRLDIEWMKRAGIGGYQLFDAARSTPVIVPERVPYMTPAWEDAFGYAAGLAARHGLEQAIASSPGWSETGGPWVIPADGMKKYVWSETTIEGGQAYVGKISQPASAAGPFQGRPVPGNVLPVKNQPVAPAFYADAVVIAFRQPAIAGNASVAHVDASDPSTLAAALQDGDYATTARLGIPTIGQKAWVRYAYEQPITIRAVSLATTDPLPLLTGLYGTPLPTIELEASDDGESWRKVTDLPSRNTPQSTLTFAPTTARYFRVSFRSNEKGQQSEFFRGVDASQYGYIPEPRITHYQINELALHREYRLDRFEVKAGFGTDASEPEEGARLPADQVVQQSDVIDVSASMTPDGTLRWTPPPGRWTVLRFGYSLTGKLNHPAALEATGLEVDKLDGDAVRRYLDTYLGSFSSIPGVRLGAGGITHLVVDSWEAGAQNWTPAMLSHFRERRGYDPRPWLPVLAGRVVDSVASSERFLWDFRATLDELVADQHFGVLQQGLKQRGMDQYVESHEGGRAFIGDGMRPKQFGEVPMSAMWARDPATPWSPSSYSIDIRESASVAHIHGGNVVAAESFTANIKPFNWSPATLKKTADLEFLDGVNRIVIHSTVHQPLQNAKPGLTLGPFGQWFNRNETWAEQARPWTDYLARSSYLLQQGRFVADILTFYGENTNATRAIKAYPPAIPAGYSYDYVDPHTIIHNLSVDSEGRIVTPGGMRYRMLHLGGQGRWMTLAMLQAVRRLIAAGATVAGAKPALTPTLADDQVAFAALAAEVFGDGSGVRRIGKGTLFAGQGIEDVLAALKLERDFDTGRDSEAALGYVHRDLGDGDLYFVSNQGLAEASVEASFRVTGRVPELWHAATGKVEPVSYRIAGGRTYVPLRLAPADAVFVVFLRPATKPSAVVPAPVETPLAELAGPWRVSFPKSWGAPAAITLPQLASWSEHQSPGVRYFSGTGVYTKTFTVPAAWLKGDARLMLDLGDVKNMASVSINGRDLGTVWHPPYKLDITSALRAGANTLKIGVTNAWANRMIGDEQPGTTRRYTVSSYRPYMQSSPLQPSGLIGPVTINKSVVQ